MCQTHLHVLTWAGDFDLRGRNWILEQFSNFEETVPCSFSHEEGPYAPHELTIIFDGAAAFRNFGHLL